MDDKAVIVKIQARIANIKAELAMLRSAEQTILNLRKHDQVGSSLTIRPPHGSLTKTIYQTVKTHKALTNNGVINIVRNQLGHIKESSVRAILCQLRSKDRITKDELGHWS